MTDYLSPPRFRHGNADHVVPLSPVRPPFAHYHSSSTLPSTPQTPYPPRQGPEPATPGVQSTGLKPYLGLSPRLLLIILTPALLPLILTIAHLIQNRSSTAALAATLKSSLLSACAGLAQGAASIQSLPRYLAMQTNDEVIRATQASILAIGEALMDCVIIIETVVTFMVDTYRSMLLCTIELAVRGTLDVLIDAVQLISSGITSSLQTIRAGIQNDIQSANNLIQEAVQKINSVTNLVDVSLSVPQVTIPTLDALANVTVSTSFEDTLIAINNSIPSLTQLKADMDKILDTPFQLLVTEINNTRLEMAASFNSSILPVPSLSSLSANNAHDLSNTLCSGLDTSLVDDTAKALHKLANIAIGLMFLILFLVWGALLFWEWRRWRAMKETVDAVEEEWARNGARDAWRTVAIVEHPVLERYGSIILHRMARDETTRMNIRWYLSYLSHPTCLALLFIALLGFLSLEFQLVALDAIKNHARANGNSTVTASADNLAVRLNSLAANSSLQYANDFNVALAAYQTRIDTELFGSWLNTTAVTLNSTLVGFYSDVEDALNATFGGTIIYTPMNTFLYCILGSKITNLEQGLTWISDHAKVALPTIPLDILMLSNSSMNEIVQPITAAAVGSSSSSSDDGLVGTLIDHFESALRVERNFYAILLGVWLAFAFVGLLVVLWHSGGSERYHAWRGGKSGGEGRDMMEKERQFRGTSPSIPRIVEPIPGNPASSSFFDYKRDSTPPIRPLAGRSGTFGPTLSALAAPGQAFLKMTGRSLSRQGKERDGDRLVHGSSEKYNSAHFDALERTETPPPIWVHKFYGAIEGVRSLFPTRGQKHGAALGRNASQRTDRSFGASQAPSAITPSKDWQAARGFSAGKGKETTAGSEGSAGQWTMIDPQTVGRALDGISDPSDSRYPPMGKVYPTTQAVYPRPLSRAPTLPEGRRVPPKNPFDEPPLPALPHKHDSVDYLRDDHGEVEGEDDEDDYEYDFPPEGIFTPASRTSSETGYRDVRVESANRVETGTQALAAVLANMERKRSPGYLLHDPIGGRI